jgi:hypothetical protein
MAVLDYRTNKQFKGHAIQRVSISVDQTVISVTLYSEVTPQVGDVVRMTGSLGPEVQGRVIEASSAKSSRPVSDLWDLKLVPLSSTVK